MKSTLSIILTFFLLLFLLIVTTAFGDNPNNLSQKESLKEQLSRPIFNLPDAQARVGQATSGIILSYLERNPDIQNPPIEAVSSLVLGKNTNTIFFEKSPSEQRPIASITKLMTAAVILDNASTTESFKVSFFAVSTEGSAGGLHPDEKLSIESLLHAMLLESSNDASIALAEYVGQKYITSAGQASVDEFVYLMNKKATDLELANTHFSDPSGLRDVDSFSTAEDVAKLVYHLRKDSSYNIIWDILKKDKELATSIDEGIIHTFTNNNPFVTELKDIIGGKTGYTQKAGESMVLVVASPDGEDEIIYVVLGSTDRIGDLRVLINWISNAYIWQK